MEFLMTPTQSPSNVTPVALASKGSPNNDRSWNPPYFGADQFILRFYM